jgi:hypothetical protein
MDLLDDLAMMMLKDHHPPSGQQIINELLGHWSEITAIELGQWSVNMY